MSKKLKYKQDVYLGVTTYSFYKNLIIFDQIILCFVFKYSAGYIVGVSNLTWAEV